jgi:hypothetical protein
LSESPRILSDEETGRGVRALFQNPDRDLASAAVADLSVDLALGFDATWAVACADPEAIAAIPIALPATPLMTARLSVETVSIPSEPFNIERTVMSWPPHSPAPVAPSAVEPRHWSICVSPARW